MSADTRTKITIKRFRIRDLQTPANVLIIGPSSSRKNAAILRLSEIIHPKSPVFVTSHPELYDAGSRVYSNDFPSKSTLTASDFCVYEDLADPDSSLFDAKRRATTIVTLPDYTVPRMKHVDYVLLFGGIEHLRRVWDDFGMLIPQFRDFRQIYLACTDEGDRYCDDYMMIRAGERYDEPEKALFWSSLRHDSHASKSISVRVAVTANAVEENNEEDKDNEKEHVPTPVKNRPPTPRMRRNRRQSTTQSTEQSAGPAQIEEAAESVAAEQTEQPEEVELAQTEGAEQQNEECCIL